MGKKIVGIIPARYNSTRFPGKPLVELLGKPMILWVTELSSNALGKQNVFVATEDGRIREVVEDAGFKVIMTSDEHLTGTDRLSEVAKTIRADIYVNIQGDEPTLNPEVILKVVKEKLNYSDCVINAMAKLNPDENPKNINIPKVVANKNNIMIYMSRLAIPGYKKVENKPDHYYKQICVYAFDRNQLMKYGNYSQKSLLEKLEDIEILRYFELDIPIKMIEVEGNSYAVDVEEDVILVERRLKEIHNL